MDPPEKFPPASKAPSPAHKTKAGGQVRWEWVRPELGDLQLLQSDPWVGGARASSPGEVGVPGTLSLGQAWPRGELLAVKGEHVFLVPSDQEDGRAEVLGQRLQPGHVQRARALPLPPDGQGAEGRGKAGKE